MNTPVLILLFLLFIIIGATIIFLGLARRSRRKFRKATIESLKIDSEYSIIKKSYDLSKSLLSAHPHIKSPVLAAAEQRRRQQNRPTGTRNDVGHTKPSHENLSLAAILSPTRQVRNGYCCRPQKLGPRSGTQAFRPPLPAI